MGNSDKDFEKSNQCAFDAYCKVILRNEARHTTSVNANRNANSSSERCRLKS